MRKLLFLVMFFVISIAALNGENRDYNVKGIVEDVDQSRNIVVVKDKKGVILDFAGTKEQTGAFTNGDRVVVTYRDIDGVKIISSIKKRFSLSAVFKPAINFYMKHVNYLTITIFMAIESSFIPFPSEIIIPPAAYKAAQGDLNIFLVFLSGTTGALIGALFNYYLSISLGRKVIYALADTKIAHLLLLDKKAVEKSEEYFRKYGNISTFIGRLVPAIRQLISIPAGLSKMKIGNFILFTTLGAAIWNLILTALGYFLYSQKELLDKYYNELSYICLALGGMFILYLIIKNVVVKKNKSL